MSRESRTSLINELEELRSSRVLTYVTADRTPVGAQLQNDAVRVFYDHLRELGKLDRLDLVVYSRGGDIDVPWRLATAIRNVAKNWNILVPFRANSATTLLALGADEVVMGPQGELGPIDPIVAMQRHVGQPGTAPTVVQDDIGVENVMAYLAFIRERAGLSDQEALAAALGKLTERIDPVALGIIYRTHTHIREVASRMLRSRRKPASEQEIGTITETLAERVYAHGHAVGLQDARNIGLPVTAAEGDLDNLLWGLLNDYEEEMKILEPLDPRAALGGDDLYEEEAIVAAIESTWASHHHAGTIEIRAKRQMPPNLAVNLNLNLQLPPGINLQQLPQNAQQFLQQMVQQLQQGIAQAANDAVQQAFKEQAPLQGFDVFFRGGCWKQAA